MVVGVFVFALVGRPHWYWLVASRILLLPVIAGIAYELIRFAGKHPRSRVLRIVLAPGLWLQRLTTREPTLDQIEVSIRALQDVLRREESRDGAVSGRGHGVARRRKEGATCRGSFAGRRDLGGKRCPWRGDDHRGQLRRVHAAVHAGLPDRRARGQDQPGGAARGRTRGLLRHVARKRAGARGHAARAPRRPLHDHDGRGRRSRPPDRPLGDRGAWRRPGRGSGRIRQGRRATQTRAARSRR